MNHLAHINSHTTVVVRMVRLFILSVLFVCSTSFAQKEEVKQVKEVTKLEMPIDAINSPENEAQAQPIPDDQQRSLDAVDQLRDIQSSLLVKISERENLHKEINRAADENKADLEAELTELNGDIELLRKTFEQIAIGGVDLSVFGVKEEKFDWREELISVVKPLIENVKSLTEKPIKIESLRRIIADKSAAKEAVDEALASIEQLQDNTELKIVSLPLLELQSDWQSRGEDLEREIQLAEFQLSSLDGKNTPWLEIVQANLYGFMTGRGLTLLLVLLSALAIWAIMRGLLWLFRKRTSESHDREMKVRYRLAAYGYRFLTGLLVAIVVMSVLYLRQDLLLLAIMIVIFFGAALALKNLLPQYIAEGRLLLNMGGVRERERVIYNGVPWQVSSINIHSRFVNPEIRGALRLPIKLMHEMVSRPSVGDEWFPSSEGDWILADDGDPAQVVRQSVDMIELRDINSVSRQMPTADYYSAAYSNLSRAKVFRVAIQFGIDYATQKIDPSEIEAAFSEGIRSAFEASDFAEHVIDITADFHSAGDSSLNYLMLTKFKPDAAEYYNKIKRVIQRACVVVCNENDWGIPFPQLSVHLPSDESSAQNPDEPENSVQSKS